MKYYWNKTKIDYYFTAIELQKSIPELKNINIDALDQYLRSSGIEFYKVTNKKVPVLIRLTLPFAILLFLTMILLSPIKFIVTGKWGYTNEKIRNWFASLGF